MLAYDKALFIVSFSPSLRPSGRQEEPYSPRFSIHPGILWSIIPAGVAANQQIRTLTTLVTAGCSSILPCGYLSSEYYADKAELRGRHLRVSLRLDH